MQLETKSLRKTINKAFLKETVDRSSFNYFKTALGQLLANIKSAEKKAEHEEHFKNLLVPNSALALAMALYFSSKRFGSLASSNSLTPSLTY